MVEVEKITRHDLACRIEGCGAKYARTEDCWRHLEDHGLDTYFVWVHSFVMKKPVEEEPAPEVEQSPARRPTKQAELEPDLEVA